MLFQKNSPVDENKCEGKLNLPAHCYCQRSGALSDNNSKTGQGGFYGNCLVQAAIGLNYLKSVIKTVSNPIVTKQTINSCKFLKVV